MICAVLLVAGLLFQTNPPANPPAAASSAQSVSQPAKPEVDSAALLKITRIYMDSFGEDKVSKEVQSVIASALIASKRFKVTENRERADAILKGTALEKTSQEFHAYRESTVTSQAGISDSSAHTKTVETARVAIRLVNPDGDVIWTTVQESKGAKYKGASADAAEMCIKQLMRNIARLEAAK